MCSIPCYAADWSFASDSNALLATDSDAEIMPLASYSDVYEGTISSTVTNYMKGIVCRFSPADHYVLFRSGQYSYRLVYGKDLVINGSVFSGSDLDYIAYDTRYYSVTSGYEGDFSLNVSNYMVYTDLESMYPVLYEGVTGFESKAILFGVCMLLLFDVCKAFFGSRRSR